MNFYDYAKAFLRIRSKRFKLLSLAAAHVVGMRYVGIFLDPVMACNLRCRMCYFSDESKRPGPSRPMTEERIALIRKALFHRALKFQIGCGAEPTLYKHLPHLISEARAAGIPYIEITTNGQLLDAKSIGCLADAGLNGMTLSLHGTTRETYEYLMDGAKFDKLRELITAIGEVKKAHPGFNLRINYTFNNLNVDELRGLWDLFGDVKIDVLQIRPIQKLGDTDYSDFDLSGVLNRYDELIAPLCRECKERGTMFVGPEPEHLREVNDLRDNYSRLIEEITYCYVSPTSTYHSDFDVERDTFESYHHRRHTLRRLLKMAFSPRSGSKTQVDISKKMNYKISD